jgi:serine/threonine-protein kinase
MNAEELNREGTSLLSRGDLAGAIATFDKALGADSIRQPHRIYYNRGTARHLTGDVRGALEDFDRAIGASRGFAEAYNNRGMTRQAMGDLNGALADFEEAIRLVPEYAEAHNNRGTIAVARGNLAAALADFTRAISIDPLHHRAHNNRGIVLQAQGNLPGALAEFDRALYIDPNYAEAWGNRGIARQQMAFARNPSRERAFTDEPDEPATRSDLSDAIADFTRAIELTPRPAAASALHNRGAARHAGGDLTGALADFSEALAIDPAHAITYVNRGTVHKALGELTAARADLDRAIELLPRQSAAAAYHNRGGVRVLQKEIFGAVADYNIALEIEPRLMVAWLSRGNARYHQRDPKAFLDHLYVLAVAPALGVEELLAMFVADAQKDAAALLRNCDRHLRINPHDVTALCRRGFSRLVLNRDTELAERDLEKAYSLCPDLRAPLAPLAEAARRWGRERAGPIAQ